jgi:hypothetical protein
MWVFYYCWRVITRIMYLFVTANRILVDRIELLLLMNNNNNWLNNVPIIQSSV